jgi:hypothetical protein
MHHDDVLRPHRLYIDNTVRRDYSYPGRTGSTSTTSTSPCAVTTRLRPHVLYVDLAVRRDYSSPVARALRQHRRAPRVLVSTLPAATIYLDYAAHRRLLRARRRLLRLRRASGCLGTSRGSSRSSLRRSLSTSPPHAGLSSTSPPHAGSSSTTSPPPRVRVPRHVARLVTWLIAPLVDDLSASHRLVVDYSASRRLVVDYFASAARPGASARGTTRHAARRTARR